MSAVSEKCSALTRASCYTVLLNDGNMASHYPHLAYSKPSHPTSPFLYCRPAAQKLERLRQQEQRIPIRTVGNDLTNWSLDASYSHCNTLTGLQVGIRVNFEGNTPSTDICSMTDWVHADSQTAMLLTSHAILNLQRGLQNVAWTSIQPNAVQLSQLCAGHSSKQVHWIRLAKLGLWCLPDSVGGCT